MPSAFILIESSFMYMCHSFFIIYHVYIYLYSLYPRSPPRQGISREQYICILGPLLDKEYRGLVYICTPCILGPLLDMEYHMTSIFALPVS